MMFFFINLLIVGFISFNNGASIPSDSGVVSFEVPIPRGQTREQYVRSVIDFWTPERMASAQPLEATLTPNYQMPSVNTQQNDDDTTERLLTPSAPLPFRNPVGPPAAGKAFFVMGGLNYMCSGSVVNTANRCTIVTAGHCVYNNTAKEFATNWIFMPHYHRNSRPHGTFPSRKILTTQAWMNKADYNNDVAIVLVHPNEKDEYVQDVAGAFGISLNSPDTDDTHLFGYPANSEKGELMDTCNGPTGKPSGFVSFISQFNGMQITCGMNGGSSGGPWVRKYNSATGSGIQVSVTSFGSSVAPGKIHGPHFRQSNIGVLFDSVKKE